MTITNKEIIENLVKHFLDSDPKEVARALAAAMIDFHRMRTFERLPHAEQACLLKRMDANDKELMDFIKDGPKNKLKTMLMNSEDI